ncbi:MAG: DUF2804 domain-containing protein [Myxococcales bacterium]|nr:DUF2804 domain-containing protein [Myxococcales bacterium]
MSRRERELTQPVPLCWSDGRLNRDAVGWARRPIVRGNLRGAWPRKKRWEYWCVTTETHLVALTYADLDYLGLADLWFLDFASGREHHHAMAIPLAAGFRHAERCGDADVGFDQGGLRLRIHDEPNGTRLSFVSRRASGRVRLEGEIFVAHPEGHETLSVVVPWSDDRFQLTSKHQCRPATGELVFDGATFRFDASNGAFGCLDYGRGVWPLETTWNWASASGRVGERVIGLNLGGQWTDGTPSTENAFVVDGRLHKISEDVVFDYARDRFIDPWRLRTASGSVDLRFVPFHERASRIHLGVLRSEVHQCFGRFEGTLGEHRLDGLLGWAEEHRARW